MKKKQFKQYVLASVLAGILLSTTGCSTMFGDNNRLVNVNSAPKGAKVIVNNVPVNDTTPTKIVVTSMFAPTIINVERRGCKTQTVVVQPEFQKVGLWNILIFPGFIVDAVTGDMMKVPEAQRTLNVHLCQR